MINTEKLAKIAVTAKFLLPIAALAAELPRDIVNTPEKVNSILEKTAVWVFAIFMGVAVIILVWAAFMYLKIGRAHV